MSHSIDLSNDWRRKRDPRRESTAIFSALVRTSEQEKGLLDENELAVGDEDIIIPLRKASMVHQGVNSTGCLVVEPDTEADMLEHDALHDALALGRQRDLDLDQYEAESGSRTSMLLAIPEENGINPNDDDKLLLSAGSQTPEGAEDSWLVPVKKVDDHSVYRDISNDDDIINKNEMKMDCSTNSKEEALIKAIREDESCVTNMCSGSHIDAASIEAICTMSKDMNHATKENRSSVCKNSSTNNKKGALSSTDVPARPPSRLKPPSSRSNFFSETRDVRERKDASYTAKSKPEKSYEINSLIKRSHQNKTTTSSNGCSKKIEDGHTAAARGKPTSRPKKLGSLGNKEDKIGKLARDNHKSDKLKQQSAFSTPQSSSHTVPREARSIGSCLNQPRENSTIGSHAPDSFKSPLIDKKKMEEGSHGKESPATARLRWLEMNPHLAFGGGNKLANTPPRDDSKPLRKTAEQLHFEAWGNNL